jgi:RNA polymerase sigma-70 factor (ECF subfamily)
MDKKLLNECLVKLKQGDDSAFDSIYHLTKQGVFSLALSILKNPYTAEDLMQETYLKVKEKILYYKDDTNGYAWILTITRNLCFNYLNRDKRVDVLDTSEHEYLNATTDKNFERDDMPVFKIAQKILNNYELQIVLLYSIYGYKHREIAEILDKPLGSILWTYNNALRKLQKEIKKEESNEE